MTKCQKVSVILYGEEAIAIEVKSFEKKSNPKDKMRQTILVRILLPIFVFFLSFWFLSGHSVLFLFLFYFYFCCLSVCFCLGYYCQGERLAGDCGR